MNQIPDPEPIARLLAIMARLRDPEHGGPWDRRQTFATIAPYTIEEAHEVADAIERGDLEALRGELGDLLFQVVYHARLAEEAGAFDFHDVVHAITDKLVHRHPQVLGGSPQGRTGPGAWEGHKIRERRARDAGPDADPSLLADIGRALPALMRALKLQKRTARVGLDWPGAEPVLEKLEEEVEELRAAFGPNEAPERVGEELGDVLFTCVNLARHAGVDPEAALRGANARFERRFRYIESRLREQGRVPEQATPEELDALWREAKAEETEAATRPPTAGEPEDR